MRVIPVIRMEEEMKALFCYDGPIYKTEKGEYFDAVLNDQMFERYLKVSSELKIAIRIREISEKIATEKMSKLQDSRISVIECPNLASINGVLAKRSEAKCILEKAIREADCIFIRLPSVIGNISVDIAKKLKKKYVIEVVGCPWDSYRNYSFKGKLIAPVAKYMMGKRILNAPYVLYVTNRFLQDRYPTKGKNINCSNVELEVADDSVLMRRIERIKNNNGKFVIGTAAGLDVLYKGQQYVIEALGELKKEGITCFEYQMIGGGTGEYLTQKASDCGVLEQIKIIGKIPHDQVFGWLDNIDIYIQPSRQEGLPRSVIEAMSRGIPCAGARTAGIPELLLESCVFSNSSTEVKEIKEILKKIINDKDYSEKLARRNFSEAQNYSRSILVERRTAFFSDYAKNI